MKKINNRTKHGAVRRPKRLMKFVTIRKGSKYGQDFYGKRIYFEGKKPPGLDMEIGKISFGKHILETLRARFGDDFRFVISEKSNSVEVKRNSKKSNIYWVRISQALLMSMNNDLREKNRDIKLDIVRHVFGIVFSEYFHKSVASPYVAGSLARILKKIDVKQMSDEDREAVREILPDFFASESIKSVNLLKAKAQIESLRELETDLRLAIDQRHSESWWQTYIKEKILIIQQGYIRVIEKLNIAIATTKFPDFLLATHDGYIDILEIKKPNTSLLKLDKDRNNYYWDLELAKAISQTENYMAEVGRVRDTLRSQLKDIHKIDLQVLRPRGIILAGNRSAINDQKEKDDLRLLSLSLKNITIVTYDELLTRLSNYIGALEVYLPKKNRPHDKRP